MRFAALFAVSALLAACTETPSYFPPCVDPNMPCVEGDGGADASDGRQADAPAATTTTDAPAEADDAPAGSTTDAH